MEQEPEVSHEEQQAHSRQEMKREVVEFVKMIVWFLLLFFIVKTYVVEPFEVQGPSMVPTLKDRERILVLKLPHILSQLPLFHRMQPITAGDIVIFDSPVESNKRYVKRVIASGPAEAGNTVSAEDGQIPKEDVTLQVDRGSVFVNNQRVTESYLPEGIDFTDSVPETHLGPGDYFVMGDNRRISKDSRSFGAINNDRIIGQALLCFWPPSSIRLIH